MMKKAISLIKEQNPDLQKLIPHLKGTIGLLFTNSDLQEIREVIAKNRVGAPAKQGQISPVTVVIPAHNTGLEPTKTSFFQALNIPTKITRGTVDILNDYVLLKPGDKVGNSEAALLQLLNIRPFSYGLTIEKIYDNGSIYSAEVLDITSDDLMKRFLDGIANIASVSLATGYPTEAAIPHMLVNGFKNLLAVAVSTDYTFKQAEATKEFLKDPSKFVVAPAKEEKKEEKKEEEEEEKKEEQKVEKKEEEKPQDTTKPQTEQKSKRIYTRDDFIWGKKIGEGAYSQVSENLFYCLLKKVYLTTYKPTGKKYATKVINQEMIIREKKVKTVKMEKQVLTMLKHPNIIKLFCTYRDDVNLCKC